MRPVLAAVFAGALCAGVLAAGPSAVAVTGPQIADGGVIRTWTGLAMTAVRDGKASDAAAARTYAMVDAAMFDAVNGVAGVAPAYSPVFVAPSPGTAGDPVVAAAAAAHDVLAALYPPDTAAYDAQLAADLAAATSPALAAKGREWGGRVAREVLAARSGDGLAGVETQPGGSGPGVFTASWNAQPRHLAPFVIADPAVYVDGGPAALTSAEYAAAYDDVKAVGDASVPNAAYQETYDYWALASGTNQPAGAWLQVAQAVSASRSLSLADTARLFALEALALADTVAPTYETKYRYRGWRPTTAIRQADTDGNPATLADAAWTSRAGSVGGSPQHYSGHSTFSAAGAEVLAAFFCTDAVSFTLDTDDAKGLGARTYPSFSAAAADAGRSRVYGGQHFEFSNQAGLAAGRAVADEVLATALRPVHGESGCAG